MEEESTSDPSDTETVLGDLLDKSLDRTDHRRAGPALCLLPLTTTLLTRLFAPALH